jgi:Domain of unknown function (DUF4399)
MHVSAQRRLAIYGVLMVGALAVDAGSQAQAQAPWCHIDARGVTNCGYYSFEQCRQNIPGSGGSCVRNLHETARPQRSAAPPTAPRRPTTVRQEQTAPPERRPTTVRQEQTAPPERRPSRTEAARPSPPRAQAPARSRTTEQPPPVAQVGPQTQGQDRRGGPSASPPGASVYFVDLKDGQTVQPNFVVHFGLRNMGVAPAGSDRENSGHHHLLIDVELSRLDEPIPNDFNHLHFGAGQTEAEVTLKPGQHTLQLVLGDKDHIPHNPPVMSPRIRVNVVDTAAPAAASNYKRKPAPKDARVYLVGLQNGSYITPNPVLRFGLINMGVAPAGIEKANTGHHHLIIDRPLPRLDEPIPNDFNHLHFGTGQTEAQVTLPLGRHTLQLLLADENHVAHDPPVMSRPIRVTVTTTGQRPRPRPSKKRQRWR